jgi:hypothetical protein
MKVYDGDSNVQDKQIQSGCTYLIFEVTKTNPDSEGVEQGFTDLFHFFGEDVQPSADTLNLMYNDSVRGQVSLVSSLHVLPLFLMSSVAPNAIRCIGKSLTSSPYKVDPVSLTLTDKSGKSVSKAGGFSRARSLGVQPSLAITTVRAVLRVGFGGALPLNQNNYLSLSTNFSKLRAKTSSSDTVSGLKIYAMDGRKTNMVMRYESAILQPGMNTEITFLNSLSAAIPKSVYDATIQTLPAADSPSYSALYSEVELEAIARDADQIIAEVGVEDFIPVVPPVGGASSLYQLGFRALYTIPNGYGYDVIPTANYDNAKIHSDVSSLVFISRAYMISDLK